MNERILRVFLAEDNQADVYLVEMALQEHGLRFTLTATRDGEAALRRMGDFKLADCPDIALLDQNLPRVNGEQVMEAIREHEHCKNIPIVIMSTTEGRRELEMAEKFNATFFRKAPDLSGFMRLGALVRSLCFAPESTVGSLTKPPL